jgi:hypothetical protein
MPRALPRLADQFDQLPRLRSPQPEARKTDQPPVTIVRPLHQPAMNRETFVAQFHRHKRSAVKHPIERMIRPEHHQTGTSICGPVKKFMGREE